MTNRVGQRLGNYRLTQLLGRGGFAEVYLGEHVRLNTQAAIKILHTSLEEDERDGFLREAQTVAHLKHPHIVRIFDFDIENRTPFLVMDYLPNGNVRRAHPKGIPLPLETIVSYVNQVASALQYAHDEKLIHRDVKPENMLLDKGDTIVLSDFGIALMAQSSRYQNTQEVAGTAAYMAPEQFQGKPRRASDQYALGIVVYEWLSGDRPFHGSFSEIASQHLFVSPSPLRERVPTISAEIEQVVMTALHKDPLQRFSNIKAFATALDQAFRQNQALTLTHIDPTNIKTPLEPTRKSSSLAPATPPIHISTTSMDPESNEEQAQTTESSTEQRNRNPSTYEPPRAMPDSPSLATTPSPVIASRTTQKQKWKIRWLLATSVVVALIALVGILVVPLLIRNQATPLQQATTTGQQRNQATPFQQATTTGRHIISIAVGTGFQGGAFGTSGGNTGQIVGKSDTFHVGDNVVLVADISDSTTPQITDVLSGGKVGNKGNGGIGLVNPVEFFYHNWAQVLAKGIYTWTVSYYGTSEASITFQVL